MRTGLKLQDFDSIFFTIDYEPNYVNAIQILLKTGIEPLASKRVRPIIIGGGAAVSSNPYPLRPFFDILAIGESEVIMPEIVEHVENFDIEAFNGKIWAVTQHKREAKRVYLSSLSESQSASAFYYSQATFKMNLVEVSRSCPNRCRFCLLSYNSLPPRWLPVRRFKELIRSFPDHHDLGLVGGSVLDHPEIDELIKMSYRFKTINPSSIKIDPKTERILILLKQKGLESITIAPETGSDNLREKLNKKIKNDEILDFVHVVSKLKFNSLKLYFMLGVPYEEDQDIEAINILLSDLSRIFKGHIEVTFSIFVPKPHTPFQYYPIVAKGDYLRKKKLLKIPKRIRADFGSYNGAVRQLLFSRGDEEMGYKIINELKGEKLDALLNTEKYLYDESFVKSLPFNLVDSGVKPDFLKREEMFAKNRKTTPKCNPGTCRICGICS
ncbi:MAG: radical SAM protein [Candidatus Hydrothermia bacterium]